MKDTISRYDMVILQLEIPMEINELVAEYAFQKGVPVMLNPAPSAPLSKEFLSHLTYLSPNEHEAADLSGVEIRRDGKKVSQEDLKAAIDALLDTGVKNVVVTLGNAGAAVAGRKNFVWEPCIDVVETKDPTAAGDSFIGAFTVAVCAGLTRKQALRFANYCATLPVSRIGAQTSLPTLREVFDLIRKVDTSGFDLTILENRLTERSEDS